MSLRYITRLSYNLQGWRKPTGDAAAIELGRTYNTENGFGHEDWLFRDEWLIDGWRYAFVQGANRSRNKLLANRKPFDLELFTVDDQKRRLYVGRIVEVEVLSDAQALDALTAFKSNNWFDLMVREVQAVNGNASALTDAEHAWHILNIRFRINNIVRYQSPTYAQPGDPVLKWKAYQLNKPPSSLPQAVINQRGPAGTHEPPTINRVNKKAVAETSYTPEHAKMQTALHEALGIEFPGCWIRHGINFIDVLVETPNSLRLYEIKTDLSSMSVLRLAIGQLLEYAFRLDNPSKKEIVLVAVGRTPLSAEGLAYLDHLQHAFRLPLSYQVIQVV